MSKTIIMRHSADSLKKVTDKTCENAQEGSSLGTDFRTNAETKVADRPKERITVRVDADILAWFKQYGKGCQTRMNGVLRSFMEAQKHAAD